VTLFAGKGEAAKVSGGDTTTPAVTLNKGAVLAGVTIESAPGIGVFINGGATLSNVVIDAAKGVGLISWCEDDCDTDPTTTELDDVTLTNNAVGLWARDTHVTMTGGRVAQSQGTTLGTGYGVVASDGAVLQMTSTTVEQNQEVGVLVDGTSGTSASLSQVTVSDNQGRGVWAQGLLVTSAAPKLTLDTCTLERNAIAGIGARSSTGIFVKNGRVADTKLAPAETDTPGVIVMVGDGIGLFTSTAQVTVDSTVLDSNARAQALVDQGGTGLTFTNVPQTVVVQHTSAAVTAPNVMMPATGMELPISAPSLAVPTH
jgi:hypothetical protein